MKRLIGAHVFKFAVVALNQGSIFGDVQLPAWMADALGAFEDPALEGEQLLEIYYPLYRTLLPAATLADLLKLKDRV